MEALNPENSSMQELDDSGCVQDASGTEHGYRGYTHLLDLCDDVLLCILKYLNPRDLKAVGHTCPRLGTLICDRMLWTRVDARTYPVGEQRLKWYLTHCLSPATAELKISGYANKFSKCLGVQDIHWPSDSDKDFIRSTCIGSQEGVDVEHFLLRMWYPHLPRRYAVSPRWPDKAEADSKKAKAEAEAAAARSEAAAAKSGAAAAKSGETSTPKQNRDLFQTFQSSFLESAGPSGSGQKPGKSDQNSSNSAGKPGNSDQNLSNSDEKPGNSDQKPGNSDQKPGISDQKPGISDQKPANSGQKPGVSEQKPGISGQNQEKTKMDEESDYPYLFEHEYTEDCKGPQFTLTTNLMRQLRNTCSNLTSLALEYCNLDYKTTNLRHFPLHLKQLSLRGSRCYNLPLNTSYLGKVQERLPELEYLDVSECDWFEPASLMPLSKLPHLTELYMRDCKRLTECVAYASLATRYGFRKLRVFDVRGSPLADSEVSALGWLPCLEELYVAPPEDFNTVREHTHSWSDTQAEFDELDTWEIEEPEYYKMKSPEPEDEEDEKEEEPDNERSGDNLLSNPWWSHERRIIVIQPNANRQQLEVRFPPFMREGDIGEEQNIPAPPRAPRPGERGPEGILPDPQPGPARGPEFMQPGPGNFQGFAIPPSYRRIGPIRCGSIDILPAIGNSRPTQREHVLEEPLPGPSNPRPGPITPRPVPADPREDPQGSHSKHPKPGTSNSQKGPSTSGNSSTNRPGPSNEAGPSNPRQGPSNPQPGPANAGEGTKRRFSLREAIDMAKRRRIEVNEDDEMDNIPVLFPPFNPEICPRLRLEEIVEPQNDRPRPGVIRFRRHDLRPIMHIDVDINRQSTIHIGSHVGYYLVSDSALLRFGRAINENVNYVHIGRHGIHTGSDSGSRPDRSNLRILSVTGYRNITDRSLEHLVTAAPYLLHIDFSETSVTPRGVELFKAVRPDCDVIFSEFGRLT